MVVLGYLHFNEFFRFVPGLNFQQDLAVGFITVLAGQLHEKLKVFATCRHLHLGSENRHVHVGNGRNIGSGKERAS